MGLAESFPQLLIYGWMLWGAIASLILFVIWLMLKQFLVVPLLVKLKGGKMDLHYRGVGIYPQYIPPSTTQIELKDAKGYKRKWDIVDKSLRLLCGIPTTTSIDDYTKTFSAGEILELAKDMANTHIRNVNSFSVPLMEPVLDEAGNPKLGPDGKILEKVAMRPIPLFDEESGDPIVDAEGKQLYKKVAMMQHFPIDENMPAYELPEFLSSKSLADRIEVESIIYSRTTKDKNDKQMLYIGAGLCLAGLGVAAIIVLVIYAPKTATQVAQAVATTTTTLAQMVSDTIPVSPPPIT